MRCAKFALEHLLGHAVHDEQVPALVEVARVTRVVPMDPSECEFVDFAWAATSSAMSGR
jgi:hypothetical protein